MAENSIIIEDKPINFRTLGKTLPKLPKTKKWKFTVKVSEFSQFGFCPYTAWHFSRGTTPILLPKIEQARTVGKIVHDELDREHEEKVAKLPKATEKTRLDRYKPLAFHRNLRVYLYRGPFLYLGKIDNVRRESDGNFYITDDKTTKQLPDRPWPDQLLQVWAYCAGMASTYWRRYNARYLCWQIRYLDKIKREALGEYGGFYSRTRHETLLGSLENFEAIYQGNDPGFEVNPNKCKVCKFGDECPFKARDQSTLLELGKFKTLGEF